MRVVCYECDELIAEFGEPGGVTADLCLRCHRIRITESLRRFGIPLLPIDQDEARRRPLLAKDEADSLSEPPLSETRSP